jgi:dGTPase
MSAQHSHRQEYQQREARLLSPHACLSGASRGRPRPDPEDPIRTCFQRDRDRVLHCKSFRRLAHKTQVFLSPAGDHYRTRITHTLEVAQIGRTIARALGLNEDLTEAIALAHDLGHTPFGHSGEAVLNRLLPGGFHHVQQSLRVVDILERDGAGLNLSHEVREGIQKHSKGKGTILSSDPEHAASTVEAQVVRVADIIAYINHDLDDAIRAQVIEIDDIPREIADAAGRSHSQRIAFMVSDVLIQTKLDEEPLIRLSHACHEMLVELRDFLYERVYDNPVVHHDLLKTERVLTGLWEQMVGEDADLFRKLHWPAGVPEDAPIERAVADFISNMTDRFALRLFQELLLPKSWPVM